MKPLVSKKITPKKPLEAKNVKKAVPLWVKRKINFKLDHPHLVNKYILKIDETNEK